MPPTYDMTILQLSLIELSFSENVAPIFRFPVEATRIVRVKRDHRPSFSSTVPTFLPRSERVNSPIQPSQYIYIVGHARYNPPLLLDDQLLPRYPPRTETPLLFEREGIRSGLNDSFHTRITPNKFRKNLVLLISRKRSTTTLQRFAADGLCSHEKPARSTSFQVNPPPSPFGKKKRKAASFSCSLFSSAVWQPLPSSLAYTYTHISILNTCARIGRRPDFFATSQSQQQRRRLEGKRPLRSFPVHPRGLPPFQTDLFPRKGRRCSAHFVFKHSDG